jgi:SAM-dependent methyltransferase
MNDRSPPSEALFATPARVAGMQDCYFYHVMDLPGHGVTGGEWDLRAGVDDYLGRFSFSGKRVLEIGPASGFLTFEMEKRGAQVTAIEVTDDHEWDYVPFPRDVVEPMLAARREHMRRLKNSFWFAHAAHGSHAQVHYGDAYRLPDALGRFDVAVMASVLLHTHSPLKIIEQCAARSDALIIVDMLHPRLEGLPLSRLVPTARNRQWDVWWQFSSDLIVQFCELMGFGDIRTSVHVQPYGGKPQKLFTVVASKGSSNAATRVGTPGLLPRLKRAFATIRGSA